MSRTIQISPVCQPSNPWDGVSFKINFSLLGLIEMSRSAQKLMFPNPQLHLSKGGDEGDQFIKNARNRMKYSDLHSKSYLPTPFPPGGMGGQFYKNMFFLEIV